jgi:hypothetical protein
MIIDQIAFLSYRWEIADHSVVTVEQYASGLKIEAGFSPATSRKKAVDLVRDVASVSAGL